MQPMTDCLVRVEQREDAPAIRALLEAAFPGHFEARLVDELRKKARPYLGLVALNASALLGHLLFTPVRCTEVPDARLFGLGPMAVDPAHQRQGIGSQLMRGGLSAARDTGAAAVFVLGHPEYYPRFGFEKASDHGLRCPWEVPDEAFMVLPLRKDGLIGLTGEIRYHPAFEGDGIAHDPAS